MQIIFEKNEAIWFLIHHPSSNRMAVQITEDQRTHLRSKMKKLNEQNFGNFSFALNTLQHLYSMYTLKYIFERYLILSTDFKATNQTEGKGENVILENVNKGLWLLIVLELKNSVMLVH